MDPGVVIQALAGGPSAADQLTPGTDERAADFPATVPGNPVTGSNTAVDGTRRGTRVGRSPSPVSHHASVRQGQRVSIDIGPRCTEASEARVGDDGTLPDLDDDPGRFTISAATLELGTYAVTIECGLGTTDEHQLLVFRQTGAERGGANSVVTAGAVGLGWTAALLGLPGLVAPALSRRRRAELDTDGTHQAHHAAGNRPAERDPDAEDGPDLTDS